MWTFHRMFLLGFVLVIVTTESQGRVCQTEDLLQVQTFCQKENAVLLDAERMEDDGLICKSLFDLWYCVAGHVPLCFHNLTEIYKTYLHSPHYCSLSHQQLRTLQNLTMETAHKQGEEDEVDVEVDVIVPLTTSAPPNGHEPPSDGHESGGEGMSEEEVTIHDHEHGGTHRHTGSGPSILSHCSLPLVVTSWLAALQMTSYLLHS